ncbi:MAG: hypothetical protein D6722_14360 [Bacteroidetes bacterium]|nr:MAG: hypothetical protein D6722_14360 [Bacteroidota bacterium]
MTTKETASIPGFGTEPALLIAIGNPGRQDDGLGWAFAEAVAPNVRGEVVYRYQLQVEDAELISRFRWVCFVDACKEVLPAGWDWEACQPRPQLDFSTHYLPPGTIVALAESLYGSLPQTWLLRLSGYEWELQEGLSEGGKQTLAAALAAWREATSQIPR